MTARRSRVRAPPVSPPPPDTRTGGARLPALTCLRPYAFREAPKDHARARAGPTAGLLQGPRYACPPTRAESFDRPRSRGEKMSGARSSLQAPLFLSSDRDTGRARAVRRGGRLAVGRAFAGGGAVGRTRPTQRPQGGSMTKSNLRQQCSPQMFYTSVEEGLSPHSSLCLLPPRAAVTVVDDPSPFLRAATGGRGRSRAASCGRAGGRSGGGAVGCTGPTLAALRSGAPRASARPRPGTRRGLSSASSTTSRRRPCPHLLVLAVGRCRRTPRVPGGPQRAARDWSAHSSRSMRGMGA